MQVTIGSKSFTLRYRCDGPLPGGSILSAGQLLQRGPDWKRAYGDQDGKPLSPGVCTEGSAVPTSSSTWVKVTWAANKHSNSYRVGTSSDVVAISPDPRCGPAIKAIFAAVGRPVPSELAGTIAAAAAEAGAGGGAAAPAAGSALPPTTAAAMAAMRDLVARSEEALHSLRADKAELEADVAAARRGRDAAVAEQTRVNKTVAGLRKRVNELEAQLAAVLTAAGRLDGAVKSSPEIMSAAAGSTTAAAAASGAPSLARMESARTRAMGSCVICMDDPAVMCPTGCGHVCVCEADAERIRGQPCPICRETVDGVVRVYLVGGE